MSPRLWKIRKKWRLSSVSTQSSKQNNNSNTDSNLFSDIELRAVGVTQRELLWAWQRPAKDREKHWKLTLIHSDSQEQNVGIFNKENSSVREQKVAQVRPFPPAENLLHKW